MFRTLLIRTVSSSLALGSVAFAQTGGGPAPGAREAMWPAPTAEDWAKPVLIRWQRTWADAVKLSRETGKPILVCVNMDGEIASEHYAGIRYRQPEIAKLYEPYVTVMASVYRHNPRDYDERGRRIPCPRFGCMTCGEHIAIEPILYEKFFDGKRIAPRHVMVELDGSESYDVYYAFDTDSVFAAIRDGIANREATPPEITRGDRTIVDRVASPDSRDREAVEMAYADGDQDTRRKLLEAAVAQGGEASVGLLRLAVFGLDQDMSKLARQALAKSELPESVDLISEALRVPMEDQERDGLIGSLERLGDASPRARLLAVVHRGLTATSRDVDIDGWSSALAGAEYPAPPSWTELADRLENQDDAMAKEPESAESRLALAEASLALAADPQSSRSVAGNRRTASRYTKLMFEDAYRSALRAEELGARGWRVDATIAAAADALGKKDEARERSAKAVKDITPGANDWSAMRALSLFADSRRDAIVAAVRAKEDWPREWMTDLHATYSILAQHPLGTADQAVKHYDFLAWFGAWRPASRALDNGLRRFPESWELHGRLRSKVLRDKGVEGIESTYEEMLARDDAPSRLEWYAGFASIVAAEFYRRSNRMDEAVGAYDRAVAHYERMIAADGSTAASSNFYASRAIAGRARIALEREDFALATHEVIASFERDPSAAASLDGLNLSPVDTAKMLVARLKEREMAELAGRVEKALGELDPEMLKLPAYEGAGRRAGRGRRRR